MRDQKQNSRRYVYYMQITRRCNNRCVFCSNPFIDTEMTVKEALSRACDAVRRGTTDIIVTGGEPTLHEELDRIITGIAATGARPHLISNGVELSDKDKVMSLIEAGLEKVHISFHSHRKAVAESVCGVTGHHARVLKGIHNCIDAGMHVDITIPLHARLVDHLDACIQFLTRMFPGIHHYVFNGIDAGYSDGKMPNRAALNCWIVPKLTELEVPLYKTLNALIAQGKTYRVERIPLCYIQGHEYCCTETRQIVKEETPSIRFLRDGGEADEKAEVMREKTSVCQVCPLNMICAGVCGSYRKIHGDNELFPVFGSTGTIIENIREK